MLFSHDTEHSLDCVVDLVNTTPSPAQDEQIPDLDALRAFVVRHDVSDVGRLDARDLRDVHSLRVAVAAVFDAPDEPSAAAAVNSLVSRAAVTPRLTDHDGYDWHLHATELDAPFAERMRVEIALALIDV